MRTYSPAGYITTTTITKATVLCSAPPPKLAIAAPPTAPPVPAPPQDPRKIIGRRGPGYDGAEESEGSDIGSE